MKMLINVFEFNFVVRSHSFYGPNCIDLTHFHRVVIHVVPICSLLTFIHIYLIVIYTFVLT